MKLHDLITEALGNVKFTSDNYIAQACLALGTINGEVTWDENRHIITVCNTPIYTDRISKDSGTIHFELNKVRLEYELVDKLAIMVVYMNEQIEALSEQYNEENTYLNEITKQIHKLENLYSIDDLCMDFSAKDGTFTIDHDDVSTDTMCIVRDAIIKDLYVAKNHKVDLLIDLKLQIDEINAKIKANTRVKYRWSLPTPCMWGSFDHGEVEGSTEENAMSNAQNALMENILEIGELLGGKFTLNVDYESIVLEEIK